MTVENIIKAVRWCFDEENSNPSSLADSTVLGSDSALMNNIIKSKIGDALRWVCLYAPAELLGGSDETGTATGILVDVSSPTVTAVYDGKAGKITLDEDFIKLARVRVDGWHRAVKVPLEEDSDEYLQLLDTNGATATIDRPQAAIIDKATKELEVWPWATGQSVSLTYVADVDTDIDSSSSSSATVAIPPRTKSAFIYYIAFLTLSAYEDSRSVRMLEIARMNLTRTENTQKK